MDTIWMFSVVMVEYLLSTALRKAKVLPTLRLVEDCFVIQGQVVHVLVIFLKLVLDLLESLAGDLVDGGHKSFGSSFPHLVNGLQPPGQQEWRRLGHGNNTMASSRAVANGDLGGQDEVNLSHSVINDSPHLPEGGLATYHSMKGS